MEGRQRETPRRPEGSRNYNITSITTTSKEDYLVYTFASCWLRL